jgi:hypothetical protein
VLLALDRLEAASACAWNKRRCVNVKLESHLGSLG